MITNLGRLKLLILFIIGLLGWSLLSAPEGLSVQGWHLLIIFVITISSIILNVAPMSVLALFGSLSCVLTGTLPLNDVVAGFGANVVWIVVFAFFIARGFVKTGLGKRIAYYSISKVGSTTLGLAYGLTITELLLAPMIPSVTARGGGIIFPVAKSLVEEYAADATSEAARKTGAFITAVCFHSNVVTSAMFLTAMAANPLIATLAGKLGITITWSSWALGAVLPGILSLLLLPLILYIICPPGIKSSKNAPIVARKALENLGSLSKNELIMSCVFVMLLAFWILDAKIGMTATATAMLGVMVLIFFGVLTWDDALSEKAAWDTMIWYAILVMLSGALGQLGVMSWAGDHLKNFLDQYASGLLTVVIILSLIYFYIHYFFASMTAHITVFYSVFVGLSMHVGMPELAAASLFAYLSSICGGLTHYGTGAAPIFYGAKYSTTGQWWKVGFIVCTANLLIWGLSGYMWWSFLGWL